MINDNDKTLKKCKNNVSRCQFNDTMQDVKYKFYKMEVTFTLCKGLTKPHYKRECYPHLMYV